MAVTGEGGGAPSPLDVLRALADPDRLVVAAALVRRERTAAQLAEECGMPPDRVRRHLRRLVSAGIVRSPDRRRYTLDADSLRGAARRTAPSRDPGLVLRAADEAEEAVLRQWFAGGRLKEVPAKRSKRLVVLTRLALEFDVGVRYPERQVNETLKRFHPDFASLRRYLVDEGFLSRDRGEYWRSGGPVPLGD